MRGVDWRTLALYGATPGILTVAALYAVGTAGFLPIAAGTLFLLTSFVMGLIVLFAGKSNGDWKVDVARATHHEGAELRGGKVDPPELDDGPISTDRAPLVQRLFYYSGSTFVLSLGALVVLAVTSSG